MELFEQIRREYRFGVGTIRGVAKQFGVHRRRLRAGDAQTARRIAVDSFILLIASFAIGSHVLSFFGISLPVICVTAWHRFWSALKLTQKQYRLCCAT